jgi:hypothetical protein
MTDFQTHDFDYKNEVTGSKGKGKKKTSIHLATEDFFVIGGILIAVILTLGIVFGSVPANELTIGAIGVSGIASGAAQMMKSRTKKKNKG